MKTPPLLSTRKRRLALTAVIAVLPVAAFISWQLVKSPCALKSSAVSDQTSPKDSLVSTRTTWDVSSGKASVAKLVPATKTAKTFVHPAWPRATVLEVRESLRKADGTFTRTTLLKDKSMADAVVVEEKLRVDSHSGDETVLATSERAASRFIFVLKADQDSTALDSVLAAEGIKSIRSIHAVNQTIQVAQLPTATIDGVPALVTRLKNLTSTVAYAEPDYVATVAATPNDTNFANQWHLNNTGQSGGLADADIDAVEGWNIATGSSDVIVALVDTGARLTHEDLAANLWTNPDEIAGNSIDDDADGFVDDIHGVDTVGVGDGDPTDDNGHGTTVAGVVGAVGNNNLGVSGVAWNAKLMILKFQGANGTGFISDAVECINYARLKGATIINNSWRSPNYSASLLTALTDAQNAGIILVAAAGNESTNIDFSPVYPAGFELSGQVVVTSTNDSDVLSSNANYGTSMVDIAAPGVNLYSTDFASDSAYNNIRSGTSLASAVVAGILAVEKGQFPLESNGELISRLYSGGDSVPALATKTATGRRANLNGALSISNVIVIPQITSLLSNTEVTGGSAVNFSITATGTEPLTYSWTLNGNPLASTTNSVNIPSASQLDAGTYVVIVSNAAGTATSTATLSVLTTDSTLGDAVEAPALTWITGRDAVWAPTTGQSFQDGDSARSGTIADGQQSLMRTTVTGPGALTFYWKVSSENGADHLGFYIDGGLQDTISGEVNWTKKGFELASGSHTLTWIYQKDASVSAGSDAAWVDAVVYTAGGLLPPTIVSHPSSQTVSAGTNVTFSVTASGSGTLTYVWKKGTSILPDENGTSLTLNSVTTGNSGNYTVEVSNTGGTAVGNVASLIVFEGNPPPVITQNPVSLTRMVGSSATFTAGATGTGPISYQWQKGTDDLDGKTTDTLTINPLALGDAGTYRAVISNPGGDSYTSDATLSVLSGDAGFASALDSSGIDFNSLSTTAWFVQSSESTVGGTSLQSGAIFDDSSTSLDAVITGPGILSFDWKVSSEAGYDTLQFQIDGTAQYTISGLTDWANISLNFPDGTHDVRWIYSKDSGNVGGADAAWVDNVQFTSLVGTAPYFITQPTAQDLIAGETLVLSAEAVGQGGISYQWKNGVNDVPSGTEATLTRANISSGDAGSYTVVATNGNGPTTSNAVNVAVFDATNPFGVVLDASNLVFASTGNKGWRPTAQISHDGVDSARSGAITDDQTSSLTATVTGPGTLSFWWMVSSEQDYDLLQFSINGVEQAVISGTDGTWAQLSYTLDAGANDLAWTYSKDVSDSAGSDVGWVDQIILFTQDTLATWTASKFNTQQQGDPAISGPNADPDGDGLSNLVEFALGGNPLIAEGALIISGNENVSGFNYATLTFTVAKNTNATTIVEQSQNLINWVSTGITTTMLSETSTTQTFKARAVVTNSAPTSLRLRINAP